MTQTGKRSAQRSWLLLALATLILAAAVRGAGAAPPVSALPNVRQAPDYPALEDPNPDVRAEAVQAIRKARDAEAVPALVAHIEDPDERVGLYIAQALVELAPPDVVPLMMVPLMRADASGRWRAAYVLGERKEPRAVSVLARALADHEVLVSRTSAVALAKIGTSRAIVALINSLTSERPAEVHAAMNGLLTLGDAAVPYLAKALESSDRRAEYYASVVLEAIGTPAAYAILTPITPQ